ncbi:hypothetical protein ATY81_06455 [Rhizobium sp. R72]|uniref:DUF5666 domain-containing protein n=1 Tax=unclassified Rhizobium TaxID=2613769 RepID=UPI000B52A946|nr:MULTISPECIES: DUF5666 domain-containing protein [unclassified Rhizobium]OWV90961.1 hypothetical protein ATY79_06065 [Rhizobium sp. R693]OWW00881.1 hypothetical protein ATY81_06455 [Rhizobium sp. R72]OWW01260.1 hypothetical protein ATY80_06455 [Rhizobium sp. R711]
MPQNLKVSTALLWVAGFLTIASHGALAQEAQRVRGAIESLNGNTLVVKTREGTDQTITLKPDWKVRGIKKASVDDIKPGDFVGVASLPKVDGGDSALEVLIFPAAMKGTGEGSRPWDLKPNSTMTNATVAKAVKAIDGHTITLTYQGKEKTISIADDTPIVTIAPAGKKDLIAGARVIVMGEKAADGTVSATNVTVGTNGAIPPM